MDKKIFYAQYRGSFLPVDSWEGFVQSTYSKAINLLHPSGIIISIVDSIDNMTDYGLTVTKFSSLVSRVSYGIQFLWEDDRIIFPDIIVDLSGASVWSGNPCKFSYGSPGNIVQIKHAFIELAPAEGFSPVISNMAGNIYSNAAGKIIEKAVETVVIQGGMLLDLSPLIGMGIGFTPSGDDFLAGIMLYEAVSGVDLINRKCIKDKLAGTTAGGRTLLILALRNSFPFYLKQFAESVYTGDIYPEEAVEKAIMHGSTSGSDALTGFLWAAEKIVKKRLN
ncbi:MAG: DUF2877 domain-containing protein [Spirochaetota bacterium]|nr:DUF2877 domain-containing protein [Spirochaetota bacterium]